jgi:hypothetical protein
MHALCATQFAGSHMCHAAEYYRTQSTITPPAAGAWIDASGYQRAYADAQEVSDVASIHASRYTGQSDHNCYAWSQVKTGTQQLFGLIVTPAGPYDADCSTAHPIACCHE